MLRHDPPARLILMTAYHRLIPAQSREDDGLHQYVKEAAVGDEEAVSTFQKLQMWRSADSRLRQMGGVLPAEVDDPSLVQSQSAGELVLPIRADVTPEQLSPHR